MELVSENKSFGGKQLQTLLRDLHPSLRKEVHYVICRNFIEQLP